MVTHTNRRIWCSQISKISGCGMSKVVNNKIERFANNVCDTKYLNQCRYLAL